MKRYYILTALFTLAVSFSSCSKEDPIDPDTLYVNLGGDTWEWTDLDYWIYDNYTKPYNIAVIYKWTYNEYDLKATLVPIDESKVQPVMNMVRRVWIDPYEQLAGPVFVKSYCPKKYVLVGSPQYNDSGTIKLGEAEGGLKVVLYRLNWFSSADRDFICEVMKTVHHEFGHILHQMIRYSDEYKTITPADYVSNWSASANSDVVARDLGFISRYARASPDEDFVEMLARIVIYGHDAFMARADASTPEGREALLKKEALLVSYLKSVWNVNLYDTEAGEEGLVTLVQKAIDDIVANGI